MPGLGGWLPAARPIMSAPSARSASYLDPRQRLHIDNGSINFTQHAAPAAPTVALAGAGAGSLSNGTYTYKVTFVTSTGETQGGNDVGGGDGRR